ncbi:MAG: hypothetical protein ACI87E_000885 [Mariniblastus sp.]|jgi:hypothetical protein
MRIRGCGIVEKESNRCENNGMFLMSELKGGTISLPS